MSRPTAQTALRRLTKACPIVATKPLVPRSIAALEPVRFSQAGPSRRHASSLPPSASGPSRSTSMPMPLDMPREDYAAPTLYTLSFLSRVIRLIIYSAVGLGVAGLTGFEGLHLYIEHRLMATPSSPGSLPGSIDNGNDNDPDGWASENVSWTGRERGGTDPRLGWKARHALRGAWICQEWGAGGPAGSIGRKNDVHGSGPAFRGVAGVEVNRVDRGYELAEEYIDLAIREAKKRGIVFPTSGGSADGSAGGAGAGAGTGSGAEVDPTALDLLLLKAGVLERLANQPSLLQAKGIYQDVLAHTHDTARSVRLSGKIGDLAQRTGGDGDAWWLSGLQRAGIDIGTGQGIGAVLGPGSVVRPEGQQKKGWFGWTRTTTSGSTTAAAAATQARSGSTSTPQEASSSLSSSALTPAVLRAAIGLLISTEAHLATSGQYAQAARLQDLALSLLAHTSSRGQSIGELQEIWISHRRALLTLHSASIAHAQKQPVLALARATSATTAAEAIIPAVPPVPSYPISDPRYPSAKLLSRDAQTLAAEANFTRGILLEKTGKEADLDMAGECFEKAMGNGERGAAWDRYYKAFARVREKLEKRREAERTGRKD